MPKRGMHAVHHERRRPRSRPPRAGRRSTVASPTVSPRGDATSTNAVSGADKQVRAPARPDLGSRPPSLRTPGRTRWRLRSRRRRPPSTPCGGTACAATFTARTYARPGVIRMRYRRWSRKRVSRRGASRKSRALRVGGVSTTTRSKCDSSCSSYELLHRHVLLRAREPAGDVAVEAVAEDAIGLRRVRSVPGARARRRCVFVSSINAHSSPDHSPSIRDGVFVSPSRPSASASRFAGSMVTTTQRRPSACRTSRSTPPSSSSRHRRCRSTARSSCSPRRSQGRCGSDGITSRLSDAREHRVGEHVHVVRGSGRW